MVFVIAISCDSTPIDLNALVLSWVPAANDESLNASVTYQCNTGYWYETSVYNYTIVCNSSGYWAPVYKLCSGIASSQLMSLM